MGEKRRQYSKGFKIEAVRLIVEEGRRISELARELGVGENLPRSWRRKSEEGKMEAFPGHGRLSPEDGELRRLRRENERLRMERDILKKAVAIFSEGMEEMFTLNRLGLPPTLTRCLATTNIIENPNSAVRRRTGRVSRWENGEMVLRWAAAAFLSAEKSFRRTMGHKDPWILEAALGRSKVSRRDKKKDVA